MSVTTRSRHLTDAEREELIVSNLSLVHYLARDLHSRATHLPLDDLVSIGTVGLIKAVDRFDPTLGRDMGGGYIRTYIIGAMQDELKSQDWAPRDLRKELRLVQDTKATLATELGRAPTPAEIAEKAEMTTEKVTRLLNERNPDFLNVDVVDLEQHQILISSELSPERHLLENEDRRETVQRLDLLRQAVTALPKQMRYVMEERHYKNRKVTDIAKELGVNRSTVGNHLREAMNLLTHGMSALTGHPAPPEVTEESDRARQTREDYLARLNATVSLPDAA